MEEENYFDTSFTDEIICPWCGHKMSDSWEMPDDGDETCDYCGKDYEFSRDITVTYETTKKVSE